ncbi:MAG: DUF2586 family protein [Hymenobacter sp.]|nr:MAG: DUF2586 family protein [Hymenobacter sp.]
MTADVTYIKFDGGLGRALTGEDHFSGLVVHEASAVPTFNTFYSLNEAEVAGFSATAHAVAHYHIEQYFAMQPQGVLYFTLSGDSLTDSVINLQNYAEGAIRQVAVLDSAPFSTNTVQTLQAAADTLETAHKGLSILYTGDFTGMTIDTLPTLTTLDSEYVSVVVGADVSGRSCLGRTLGTVSLAAVSQNIGEVKVFNVVKDTEYDVLGFATGEAYRGVTDAKLNALELKNYIFLRKYTGLAGSFHSDANTATARTSDFLYIENVRTIEKAERAIRVALLPELMTRLKLDKGLLAQETISKFELLVQNQLDAMVDNTELSDYKVVINPAQKVASTSKLEIQVGLTPLGIARQIVVGIGFQL